MLDKTYDAASVEPRIHEKWERAGAFAAGAGSRPGAESFCIVIPPPNVTGSLHMGHALNNTLQDVLVRFERMRGKDVLWQPGMDHAGIATQMVVERQMMERQEPGRRDIGRQAFLEKVWTWKAESGGMIVNQLKRLGASCDWSRERFTMDEGLSRAVLRVFVELYRKKLIFRDKRLVNWDPKLQTAISDLEVEQVETDGTLWHFRYPLADGRTFRFPVAHDEAGRPTEWEERGYIVVATTRPETMLGDTGVAVHPDDERYRELVGTDVILPLVGRRIPIVADDYADPEAGSGAVKITPAHDFNDFEVGRRHDLDAVNIFDRNAALMLKGNSKFLAHRHGSIEELAELNKTVRQYDGKDRFEVRSMIVERMKEKGLLDKTELHTHVVPHGDRSGVPIEPYLTNQWYVDAKALAAPAISSVREGRTVFVPKAWKRTYFDWMENIQPWCVSRQLWWGHQLPVWYGRKGNKHQGWRSIEDDPEVFVATTETEAVKSARATYGCEIRILREPPQDDLDAIFQQVIDDELNGKPRWEPIWRDEDVLDTWFSSALWPFSTLGWPDETPELARYYPTSVLVTAFDIIFFWVARMMMMGLQFTGKEPFHTVYIHALVRDEHGAKMAKSKGNVIDPLELIDEYGADALRFTLAAMAAQGRDIKLSAQRVAGSRNFGTKLWNAARFCEINECRPLSGFDPAATTLTLNRWILTEAAAAAGRVTGALEAYRFNEAADAVYHFVWDTFCDWYLELAKPILAGDDAAARTETQATAASVLTQILALLHPFMPFMTEALWDEIGAGAEGSVLALSPWPALDFADEAAAAEINWLVGLVSGIRSVRAEMNVPPGARTDLVVVGASGESRARLDRMGAALAALARVEGVRHEAVVPRDSAQIVHGEATVALPLAGVIDFGAEEARLQREIGRVDGEIDRLDRKLSNEKFVSRAPEHLVAAEREKRSGYAAEREKLIAALHRVSR